MTARLCQKTTGSTPWWLGMKDQTMPALNFHTTFRSSNRSAPLSMCLLSGPPSPRAPWLTISSCLWHSSSISVHVLLWERRNVRIIIHVTVWGRTFQHLDQQVEERVVVSDDSISDLMDGGCSNASWGQWPLQTSTEDLQKLKDNNLIKRRLYLHRTATPMRQTSNYFLLWLPLKCLILVRGFCQWKPENWSGSKHGNKPKNWQKYCLNIDLTMHHKKWRIQSLN